MAITTTEQTSIIKLVLGMFNAAPGATNLSSIVAHYEANGKDLSNLADALASNAAFTDQFAGLVTVSGIANKMAANFGLTSGTAYTNAVAYFEQEITAGKSNQSIMKAAVDYLSGSTVDAVYADVVTTLTNKYTVALDYSVTKQLSAATVAELQAVVASVDATAASVTAAIATNSTGTTYNLTTGVDNFTGTANDDTFVGVSKLTAADAADTLTVVDTIDGGAGTDTLFITSTGLNTDVTDGATISNIEYISVRNTAATGAISSVSATGLEGVTALGTGDVTVTNLATGKTLTTSSTGAAIISQGYVAAATAASTTLTAAALGTLTLVGAGITSSTITTTGTTASTTGAVDVLAASAITIGGTSALTLASLATTSAAATLTVTGAGASKITAALDAGITTVNAAGATGAVTLTGSATATTVTTLGTGDDSYTTGVILSGVGAVDAGTGTDTLVLGTNVGHANTAALAAKYTGFETLSVDGAYNAALISTLTAITLTGNSAITGMTATQAANVTITADVAATSLALATATGTSDVLSIKMGSGKLATEATDFTAALTVTGFETLNIATNAGPTAAAGTTGRTTDFSHAFVGATLSAINLTGTAFNLSDIATTKAVTIDATALTGDGQTVSLGLTAAGSAKVGSTINGSAVKDVFTIGAEGSAYNGNAGNDTFSTTVAVLVADGTTDGTINGGDGTDTLTVTGAAQTLTDNHFTKLSNLEKLTTAATGVTSITTGTAFNTAFANGVTITQASKADGSALTYNMGLSSVATTIVLTTAENGSDATATQITTGSAADNVTVTAASYVGFAGALTNSISTGAGDDTITFSTGTLANAAATGRAMTITAGTGADTITESSVNGNDAEMNTSYVIAAGDSTTTAWDKITGATASNGTFFSDGVDFAGTAAIGALATSTDSGTILTHAITAGVATFDDASVFATAIVINSANLADVVGYLGANTQANGVIAFAYDADSDGTAESTMLFHQGATAGTTDSLVQLTSTTGIDALITTNVAGANDFFIA